MVRCRRAYSPSEIRSIRAVGLEQSPAYFSRRVRSMLRTHDREHRARSCFQPRSTRSPGSFRSRQYSRAGQCPLFRIEIEESYHQEGENLGVHPLEVDPDPLPDLLLILLQDPHPHLRKGFLNLCHSSRCDLCQ